MKILFFAYLDPGAGSLILQVLIGGVAAGLFAVKTYWLKIKSFFVRPNVDSKK